MHAPTNPWELYHVIQGLLEETHAAAPIDIWSVDMNDPVMYYSAASIFVAGVLASASGIGGGGIFVAVLMLVGHLTPHQAVPLSKALIFSGAIMSFCVNVSKKDANGRSLIQFELVKNMVPMALGGTLLGVMLNIYTPRAILVLCLSSLLVLMTMKLFSQGINRYKSETALAAALSSEPVKEQDGGNSTTVASEGDRMYFEERALVSRSPMGVYRDAFIMFFVLAWVIACGVMRGQAADDSWLPVITMGMGITLALMTARLFRCKCMNTSNLEEEPVSLVFPVVSFFAGICSGLMGIGGGLIFAPLLLMMGVDPAKAVCTSATCVIFTATSTTLQYLFLGRVLVYWALFLGTVSLIASVFGTRLVHVIRDKTGRSSILIFIVAVAVGVSSVLTMYKGIKFAQEDWSGVHFHIAFGYLFAQICAATGWKFTTSMDDIMWLSPFLAQTAGKLVPTLSKLLLYIIVVQTVVLLATSVVWGSDWLAKVLSSKDHTVNVHAYLVLFSGSLLSCYAVFLFREWYQERFGEKDEEEEEEEEENKDMSASRLIIVSFLGSLDELASFTTALLGGLFSPFALSIGCMFACTGVASMCLGALRVRALANCILSIPIWLIIGTVSIYNIVNGVTGLIGQ